MYPLTYYETFMRYEPSHDVFVAMPFTNSFQNIFNNIISPAIKLVSINNIPLNPRIINRGTTGSPDIHEKIFDAIIHSRLVIADLSVQANYITDNKEEKWQANANVAYEVGLACTWRNPEDILLIHQPHKNHRYSFDIQNLRHIEYTSDDNKSILSLADEILRAINQSSFLAKSTYLKIVQSISPSSVQFMFQESCRAFPVIRFLKNEMPMFDTRIHAIAELLSFGALKNRNVFGPQKEEESGVTIIYQWTELGLKLLQFFKAINDVRKQEILSQIASVPEDGIPPINLLEVPIK